MQQDKNISPQYIALYAVCGIVSLLMLIAIGVVISLIFKEPEVVKNDKSISRSRQASELIGNVTSTANLKGLKLRINQIETCSSPTISAFVGVSSDDGVVRKGLDKNDVKVYVDGVEIKEFSFDAVKNVQQPLNNVLVIDHSGSMAGAPMDQAKAAAANYASKLQAGDKVAVVQFDTTVDVLQNLTEDKQAAINAISGIQSRGDTAVYDAVDRALGLVPDCGRKVVTVLSDGDDRQSKSATIDSIIQKANKENLPIFAVGVNGEGFNPAAMRKIADSTGGQYLEATNPNQLPEIYSKVDGQLTGQFIAKFKIAGKKDGREVKLKIVSVVEGSETISERSFIY